MENGSCEACRQFDICRHCGEFKEIDATVKGIQYKICSPIRVTIECSRYEAKTQKQDGFFNIQNR